MTKDIPVLFIIFNRPETEELVLEKIREIKPKKLYIAADGPRYGNPSDIKRCKLAQDLIGEKVDWNCKIYKMYRNDNLGCKLSVSKAIEWFFENEEMGIILEDDCCPDISFFRFCETGLKRYKNEEKVMMISGSNHQFNKSDFEGDAYFSKLFPVWGWATWRRAWNKYDINMKDWRRDVSKKKLKKLCGDSDIYEYYDGLFSYFNSTNINTWDIQWSCTCLYNNGLCLVSKNNLISNLGFVGTHSSRKDKFHGMPTKTLGEKINLPKKIIHNIDMDKKELLTIREKERSEVTMLRRAGKVTNFIIVKTKWLLGMK